MSSRSPSAPKHPAYAKVNAFAKRFPEAHEEFPWGHSAIKVRGKIFVSMGEGEEGLSMSMKLPDSGFEALLLPFTEPTHYGMGKHGWVTVRIPFGKSAPLPLIRGWIEESYRAIAPKKLVKVLDEDGLAPERASKRATAKKAGKKKTAVKRASKATGGKTSSKATKRKTTGGARKSKKRSS